MAPMPPLGRDYAIRVVEAGQLPFSLGSPHAVVMILQQEGKFRIRELVVDQAEVKAAMDKAMAEFRSFQPEHVAALARPTGKIHAEGSSREELVAQMRTMKWPSNW